MTRSFPAKPDLRLPFPGPPFSAWNFFWYSKSARVRAPGAAWSTTSPPRPPLAPSGPPLGTNFSRRKLRHPFPPLPPRTSMEIKSTNFMGSPVSVPSSGKKEKIRGHMNPPNERHSAVRVLPFFPGDEKAPGIYKAPVRKICLICRYSDCSITTETIFRGPFVW